MLLIIASAFFYTEMKNDIFTKMLSEVIKVFWIKWELHGMVGFSLSLQFVLLLFGSRWKLQGRISPYVTIIVWSAYLTADWIATVALSTLLKAKEDDISGKLVVFWTPFLLLHLGGPHTINAITLADNELWLRSFLGFIIQVGVAVYVYIRFRTNSNILTYMAIPVFVAGIIKYGERIWILRAASRKRFSKSIFSVDKTQANPSNKGLSTVDDRAKTLDQYLRSKGVIQEGKNICKAFRLYKMFMPLFLDLKLRFDKDLTQKIILPSMSIEFEGAFKLVEMELGFLYDVLYTKTKILQSTAGIILRGICLLSILSALTAFSIKVDKSSYPKPDVAMTYMLLAGAFFLDVFAIISHVSSNWTMLDLTIRHNKLHNFISCLRFSKLILCGEDKKEIASMAQHSFINYCLNVKKSWWPEIVRIIDTEDTLAKFCWTTWEPVNDDLKKFIYSSLEQKQEKYRESKFEYEELLQLLTGKGNSVLIREGVLEKIQRSIEKFQRNIEDEEFSHYLLLWNIATSLLFHANHGRYTGSYYRISKLLSDYMMYLLLLRPNMLPKGIGEVRIRETRDEVINFLNNQSLQTESEAINALLNINVSLIRTDKHPDGILVQSKSVLSDGCELACQLERLVEEESPWDHEEKWKMIADVWMEMLVFAASKCEWREHKIQMKNGKELLTHVALLMVHFGLTGHVQVVDIQSNQVEPMKPQEDRSSRWDWELSHLAHYLV